DVQLDDLPLEGLGAAAAPEQIGDAEHPAEAGALVALGDVPRPAQAGLRVGGIDRVGRERLSGRVAGQAASCIELRLAAELLGRGAVEVRRAVVAEAGPDLEPHAFVEEAVAGLPELLRGEAA